MKTELRIAQHSVERGERVVEAWHNGQFIAELAGTDGPGVRVISKHSLGTKRITDGLIEVLHVAIGKR